MKIQRCFAICCALFVLVVGLLPNPAGAEEKKKGGNKYACSEPNPASQCNAGNTCGSASAPCSVDVKRTVLFVLRHAQYSGREGKPTVLRQHWNDGNVDVLVEEHGVPRRLRAVSPFDPPDPIMGGSKKSVHGKGCQTGLLYV